MENFEFDNDEYEARIAERYRQLARFDAFDNFIDMALDGFITIPEAIGAFLADDATEAFHLPD